MADDYLKYPALRGALTQQTHLLEVVLKHITPAQRQAVAAELLRSHNEEAEAEPEDLDRQAHEDGVIRWLTEQALQQLRVAPGDAAPAGAVDIPHISLESLGLRPGEAPPKGEVGG